MEKKQSRATRKIRRLWNENKELKDLVSELLRSLDSSLFLKYWIRKNSFIKIRRLRDLTKKEVAKK